MADPAGVMDIKSVPEAIEWQARHAEEGGAPNTARVIRGLLAQSLETATADASGWRDVGKGPGSTEGEYIDWLTFKDAAGSVVDDVRRIRNHPLVPGSIPIHGYVYDVRSGRLVEVDGAAAVGQARG